jgi:type IV secretion system protein VirB9
MSRMDALGLGMLLALWCGDVGASLSSGAGPAGLGDSSSRTQRFRYDPEVSFAILALPGVPTDVQLAADEHVTGFALGDTVQWVIEELPGHVFVKPLKPDLFTAGTLVTDRRTYQLTLRSGRPRDDWMQRVSWTYPDLVVLRAPAGPWPHAAEWVAPSAAGSSAAPLSGGQNSATASIGERSGIASGWAASADRAGGSPPAPGGASAVAAHASVAQGVDPARLDFDYAISGEAAFRPLTIFDDGRSTWLRLRPRESLPALFLDGPEGLELVHYAVRGDWLVIPRLTPRLILKLGRSEVQIERHPGSAETGEGESRGLFRR